MKFTVIVLAMIGAFITALGVLPSNGDMRDRVENSFLAFVGIGILIADAVILVTWFYLRGPA